MSTYVRMLLATKVDLSAPALCDWEGISQATLAALVMPDAGHTLIGRRRMLA